MSQQWFPSGFNVLLLKGNTDPEKENERQGRKGKGNGLKRKAQGRGKGGRAGEEAWAVFQGGWTGEMRGREGKGSPAAHLVARTYSCHIKTGEEEWAGE